MKLAIYKSVDGNYETPCGTDFDGVAGYVRLTEFVDVEFPRLPPEVTVPAELKNIDDAETELRNKFAERLADLQAKRANLLSLTHQVADE